MVHKELTITFDEEELTELSSDEEDDAPVPASTPISAPATTLTTDQVSPVAPVRAKSTRPTTQKATENSRARSTKLPAVVPPLRVGRTTTASISSLNAWLEMGSESLDLDADYQRGVVWNDTKQIGLIDSIFNNFYIPPLVFSVIYHPDGSESRVCIDGKQRLTSIRRFVQGEIYFWDREMDKRLFYKAAPRKRPKLLSDKMRRTFDQKQLTCCEYEGVTPEQEREIFQRVQLGMALGPADRLPAINGPHADLVRSLRLQIESTEGFSQFKNESRGKDFQALAQIVFMIEEGLSKKTCEATTKNLEVFLAKKGVDTGGLKVKVNLALETFTGILQDPVLSRPLLERPLTSMEFVMAVYIVHLHRTTFSLQQLSQAILQMRAHWSAAQAERIHTKADTKAFVYLAGFVKQITKAKLTDWVEHTPLDPDVPMTSFNKRQNKAKTIPAPESNPTVKAATVTAKRKATAIEADEDSDDECQTIPRRPKKKAATTVKIQETTTPTPTPEADKSQLKSKIDKRSAATSKAKTTVKKVSPSKSKATSTSAPVRAPVPAAFAVKPATGSMLDQIATPSVKPGQRGAQSNVLASVSQVRPIPRALSRASSTASMASASTSRLPPPPAASAATSSASARPPVSSGSASASANNPLVAFGGIATPSPSPYLPSTVPQYVGDLRASPTTYDAHSVSHAPPPPLSADRMAPLRLAQEAAERKRNSLNGSTSSITSLSDLAGHVHVKTDGPSSSVASSSTSSNEALKNIRFNKASRSVSAPNSTSTMYGGPELAQVDFANAMSGADMEVYLLCQQPVLNPMIPTVNVNVNAIPKPAQAPSRSPSTDPRLRVQRKASAGHVHGESRLPTPPQSGLSPQIPQEQLFARPTHTHEQMIPTATTGLKRSADVSGTDAAQAPRPSLRVLMTRGRPGQTGPQPPYPVPGDRNNR